MPYFRYKNIAISGIAAAVPDNRIDVMSCAEIFGEEAVRKFSQGTGINSFVKALPDQTASDLGYAAAQKLITEKNIAPESVGALVFVTQSPDYRRPSSASVLHKRLGLSMDCAAMEINLGCSGFVYGLQTVCSMIASSDIQRALLVLGETATKLANPKDKAIAMLYGDAGAAILIEKRENAPDITISLKSDGGRYRAIVLPAGGFRDMNASHDEFVCSDGNTRTLYDIYMDGTSVFSFTISDVPDTIRAFLDETKTETADYDAVVFHQANSFILKQLSRKFKIPKEKVPVCIDHFGNTGGVSIPLTISDAFGDDSSAKHLLVSGFGIGLSWGVASFDLNTADVYAPVITSEYYAEGKITPDML